MKFSSKKYLEDHQNRAHTNKENECREEAEATSNSNFEMMMPSEAISSENNEFDSIPNKTSLNEEQEEQLNESKENEEQIILLESEIAKSDIKKTTKIQSENDSEEKTLSLSQVIVSKLIEEKFESNPLLHSNDVFLREEDTNFLPLEVKITTSETELNFSSKKIEENVEKLQIEPKIDSVSEIFGNIKSEKHECTPSPINFHNDVSMQLEVTVKEAKGNASTNEFKYGCVVCEAYFDDNILLWDHLLKEGQ